MVKNLDIDKRKAVILAAGVGSRIRPMTDNCPKSLLKVNGRTILEMMISHIQACGINEVVFVLGYLQEQIKVRSALLNKIKIVKCSGHFTKWDN